MRPRTFELIRRSAANAQIFWAGDMAFVQERSSSVIPPAARAPAPAFQVAARRHPLAPVRSTDTAGEILVPASACSTTTATSSPFATDSLRPSIVASVTRQGPLTDRDHARRHRPSLLLAFGGVDRFSVLNDLAMITPVSLALTSIAAFALLGACVVVIGRSAFGQSPDDVPGAAPWRLRSALWLAMLFLVVFSAKLLLIRDNPAPTPFYDQWDGEAAVIFVPYNQNSLGWPSMFGFHNEHRVFFSRLLALGLLTVNGGQWDPRLEQVANAAIHSLTAVLLTAIFWVAGGRRRLDLLVLVAALTFALPFGWENTLIGFQSAFYFCCSSRSWPCGSHRSPRRLGGWWLVIVRDSACSPRQAASSSRRDPAESRR